MASVQGVGNEAGTEGVGAEDAIGRLMLNLLGTFAEFERTLIRERQGEGIRLAQKLTAEHLVDARRLIESGVRKAKVARNLQVDRTTLYRALARGSAEGAVGE